MKLLRETIRRLILQESACDPINDKVAAGINEIYMQKCTIEILDDPPYTNIHVLWPNRGSAGIIELDGEADSSRGNCHGAWIVAWSSIAGLNQKGKGIGALLYDVAIETAGGNGLASDRDSVSPRAFPMWNYYYSNPAIYDKEFIDPLNPNTGEGRWTDNLDDDCVARSWMKTPTRLTRDTHSSFMNDEFMEDYKEEYMNNPLNYVYTKKDQSQPTIQCLREMELMK